MYYPFLIKQNETNPIRRRIPVVLVQLSDGWTGIAGKTLVAGEMKISKDGAAFANVAGTVTDLTTGDYYYEATAAEVDTLGPLMGRWIPASTARSSRFAVQVVAFDPYDAAGLGLSNLNAAVSTRSTQTSVDAVASQTSQDTQTTAINAIKAKTDQFAFTTAGKVDAALQAAGDFPQAAADKVWLSAARTLSAAGVQAIWDALTSALIVVGSIGKRLADNVDATVNSRSTQISVDTKASQVSVDGVSTSVGTKASQVSVDTKASQTSVDTIVNRVTAQRATNLDNLDTLVSSRATSAQVQQAPQDALQGVGITSGVVGRLDVPVSSRASQSSLDAQGQGLTQAQVRQAVGLASANLDTQLQTIPTATQNADTLLKRDMSQITGEARRSPLNAIRAFVNTWRIGGGIFTVKKENGTTEAWAADVNIAGDVFEFTPRD